MKRIKRLKMNTVKRSGINKFLDKFIYFNKALAYIYLGIGTAFALSLPFWEVQIAKTIFGEDNIFIISIIFMTILGLFLFGITGFAGKIVFKNRFVECPNCGKVSKGDVGLCPKCGTRVGWDDWGIRKDSKK